MRKCIILSLAAVALLASITPAPARPVKEWSYEQLFKEADLVVFAIAQKTEAADDKPTADSWPYHIVAQNTTFTVSNVLKGKADGDEIKVLHFKFGELKESEKPKPGFGFGVKIRDGPNFVEFRTEPYIETVGKNKGDKVALEYLLFLKRTKDGRYEPVSGKIDPDRSVREVSRVMDRSK